MNQTPNQTKSKQPIDKTYDKQVDKPLPSRVLSDKTEAWITAIRERIKKIDGGMHSHHAQDLRYELNLHLDSLEADLREEYGEPRKA